MHIKDSSRDSLGLPLRPRADLSPPQPLLGLPRRPSNPGALGSASVTSTVITTPVPSSPYEWAKTPYIDRSPDMITPDHITGSSRLSSESLVRTPMDSSIDEDEEEHPENMALAGSVKSHLISDAHSAKGTGSSENHSFRRYQITHQSTSSYGTAMEESLKSSNYTTKKTTMKNLSPIKSSSMSDRDYLLRNNNNEMDDNSQGPWVFWRGLERQSLFVLLVCSVTFCLHEVDYFMVGVTAAGMQKSQGWGRGDGTGVKYDVLVGPMYTMIHIFCSLPIGWICDRLKYWQSHYARQSMSYSDDLCNQILIWMAVHLNFRGLFLSLCLFVWSLSMLGTALSTQYWAVLLCRAVLAVFTASTQPVCVSLISDYYCDAVCEARKSDLTLIMNNDDKDGCDDHKYASKKKNDRRSTIVHHDWILGNVSVMALFNFAIYFGFSLAFAVGNAFPESEWRHCYTLFGLIGLVWSLFVALIPNNDDILSLFHRPSVVLGASDETTKNTMGYQLRSDHQSTRLSSFDNNDENNSQLSREMTAMRTVLTYHTSKPSEEEQKSAVLIRDPLVESSSLSSHSSSNSSNNNHGSSSPPSSSSSVSGVSSSEVFCYVLKSPTLILLLFASLWRNCGGFVWAFQANNYYRNVKGQSNSEIAAWMSWIPAVAGSFGCMMNALIADWLAKKDVSSMIMSSTGIRTMMMMSSSKTSIADEEEKDIIKSDENDISNANTAAQPISSRGMSAHITAVALLVVCCLISFPFALGALLLPAPLCYGSLLCCYLFSECWICCTVAIVVAVSPARMKSTILSVYYFTIGLAGLAPLLVTPLSKHVINSFQWTIVVLFPSVYGSAGLLFLCLFFSLRFDLV